MNDNDYIRKAIELAIGWKINISHNDFKTECVIPPLGVDTLENMSKNQMLMDALSAQLIRQVNELDGYSVGAGGEFDQVNRALVYGPKFVAWRGHVIGDSDGKDLTMNIIRAIIDSEVLENE